MVWHGKVRPLYRNQPRSTKDRTDESIPGSAQSFPVSDIYAEAEGTGYRLQFSDSDGNVYLLVNGKAVKIATIVNGEFIRDNDAQADRLLLEIKAPPKIKGAK